MSYSNSFPAVRPTTFDFANSGKLDSRISFSRADTPPTYAAPSAVHYWSNEKHLSSENLVRYSNDLSNGDWTKARLTVASTNNSAPDGTTTASSLLEETDNSTHTFYEDYTSVVGVSYTHVWYAKANGRTKFVAYAQGSSCVYDLTAATATNSGMDAVSITALGSSWFKCVATKTATTTSGRLQFEFNNGSSQSYAGDVTKGLLFWGFNISSTGQTVTNSVAGSIHREFASTLKSVANAGDPRFEYDPASDGQSEGLLIESQATNKATYSEDFTNAVYNNYRSTIESASAVAPDGTLTASFLREDATASNNHFLNAVTATGLSVGTTQYAVSVFVKAAGRSRIQIYDNNQNTPGSTTFDLSSGTVVTGDGSIKSCGNGWYRCTIIPTANYSATSSVYMFLDNGSGTSYTGNSYSGILVWGYQLETGVSASSSYISSNSGSSTTRSADSCSVATADFGYTGGPVSIVIETPAGAGEGYIPYLFTLSGGDQNFYAFKNTTTASASDDWRYQVGGTGTTVSGSAGSDKIAIRWDTGDVKAQFSTGVSSTNSGAVETAFTDLKIGMSPANLYQLNGNFKRLSLYSVALSDTELATLVD